MDLLELKKELENVKGKRIAVIGDVMLDQYFWGEVSRISPEAPVPVVDITDESYHLGGAANVVQNLLTLGVKPLMCGLLGDDNRARRFIEICNKLNIDYSGLYRDTERLTTVKTRVMGNNQQIVRMDRESRLPLSKEGEDYIFDCIEHSEHLDGIIFEDYDKGTISQHLIALIIAYAKKRDIPVFVDPKHKNFANYGGATLFKPNRREAEIGLDCSFASLDDVRNAGKMLLEKYTLENVLITLGADGMMLFENNGDISHILTTAKKIADVSGAGDTAIATLAAMFVAGVSIKDAALISNYAAGVVCERPGIVAITPEDILQSYEKEA